MQRNALRTRSSASLTIVRYLAGGTAALEHLVRSPLGLTRRRRQVIKQLAEPRHLREVTLSHDAQHDSVVTMPQIQQVCDSIARLYVDYNWGSTKAAHKALSDICLKERAAVIRADKSGLNPVRTRITLRRLGPDARHSCACVHLAGDWQERRFETCRVAYIRRSRRRALCACAGEGKPIRRGNLLGRRYFRRGTLRWLFTPRTAIVAGSGTGRLVATAFGFGAGRLGKCAGSSTANHFDEFNASDASTQPCARARACMRGGGTYVRQHFGLFHTRAHSTVG